MAYDGYFNLGGVEIINAARTAKYVGSLMPTFGLDDCTDCDDLREALGDEEYRSPVLDPAPWLDTSDARTNDFWGVYPLGVSGVDDSTRQVSVTELTTDGAVTGLPRASSREIRYDVMLVGRTEAGVMAGFHWLNRALDAYRCGEQGLGCSGTDLDFFSSCPPACDYSACTEHGDSVVDWEWNAPYRYNWIPNGIAGGTSFALPWMPTGIGTHMSSVDWADQAEVTWQGPQTGEVGIGVTRTRAFTPWPSDGVTRVNLAVDPHMQDGANWVFQNNTGGASTDTNLFSATDTPDGAQGYQRSTITTAGSGGNSGPYYRQEGTEAGQAGDVLTLSLWVRSSVAATMRASANFRAGGVAASSVLGPDVSVQAGVWTRLSVTATATAAYDGFQVWAVNSTTPWPLGATIDATMVLVEPGDVLDFYFDGYSSSSRQAPYLVASWIDGTPNDSPSSLFINSRISWNEFENPSFEANADHVTSSSDLAVTRFTAPDADTVWIGDSALQCEVGATPGTLVFLGQDVPIVLAGESVAARVMLRTSGADARYRGRFLFFDSTGAQTGTSAFSDYQVGANAVWTPLEAYGTAPAGTVRARFYLYVHGMTVDTPDAGLVFTTDGWIAGRGASINAAREQSSRYFDGGTELQSNFITNSWFGIEHESRSQRVEYPGPGDRQPAGTPVASTSQGVFTSREELQVQARLTLLDIDGVPTGDVFTSAVQTGSISYGYVQAGGVSTVPFYGYTYEVLVVNPGDIIDGDTLSVGAVILELEESNEEWFDGFSSIYSDPPSLTWWMGEQYSSPGALSIEFDTISQWSLTNGEGSTVPEPRWSQTFDICISPYNVEVMGIGPANAPVRLTRTLSGLIPGAWYRAETVVNLIGNDAPVTVQARGTTYRMDIQPNATFICGNSPATRSLWFRANSPVMFLDFTLPATSDSQLAFDNRFGVRYLEVSRVSEDYNVYQTTFPDDGTVLNGWSLGTAPANGRIFVNRQALGYSDGFITGLTLAKQSTTNVTFPSGQVLMRRQIRGLTPGVSYTVVFQGEPQYNGATDSKDITYTLAVDGITSVTAEATGSFAGGGTEVLMTFDFVATDIAHDITLSLGATLFLSDGTATEEMATLLYSFSVQGVEQGSPPLPDGAADYRRTLYRVTALTGPTIEERYDKSCGFMLRASFGLVAGVPHQFGPLISAGSALGGSSSPLEQVDCINGEAVRYNLISNPSFESNINLWELQNSGPLFSRSNTAVPGKVGTWVASVTPSSDIFALQVPYANRIGVEGGISVTLSAHAMNGMTFPQDAEVWMEADFYDTTGMLVSTSFGSRFPLSETELTRAWSSFVVPTSAVSIRPRVVFETEASFGVAGSVYMDAVMLEFGGVPTSYFDGSFANSSWIGTANASPSEYTPAVLGDLIDPDCPPLPAPPSPPTIEEECIIDPGAWTRYTIYIGKDEIPLFSSVLPVVTMRTGDSTARQVRMRWYPNPDDLTIDELPPCEYEGEIIVSYVPPNAVMTIDGITRDATASVNGGDEQPATQLLYGPDGGPMVWPELRCNQGYVFTVDVDIEDDVSELDVLLSLGLKV